MWPLFPAPVPTVLGGSHGGVWGSSSGAEWDATAIPGWHTERWVVSLLPAGGFVGWDVCAGAEKGVGESGGLCGAGTDKLGGSNGSLSPCLGQQDACWDLAGAGFTPKEWLLDCHVLALSPHGCPGGRGSPFFLRCGDTGIALWEGKGQPRVLRDCLAWSGGIFPSGPCCPLFAGSGYLWGHCAPILGGLEE